MNERIPDEEFEALAEHHIGHPPGSKVFRLAEEARRARESEVGLLGHIECMEQSVAALAKERDEARAERQEASRLMSAAAVERMETEALNTALRARVERLEKESEARWHAAGCAGSPHDDGVEREMCDCAVGTVARARIATLTAQVERLEKLLHRYADNYQLDNECACDRCRLLADAQEALRAHRVDPFSLPEVVIVPSPRPCQAAHPLFSGVSCEKPGMHDGPCWPGVET